MRRLHLDERHAVARPQTARPPQPVPDGVVRFIDRLAEFRPNDWMDAADAAARDAAPCSEARVKIDVLVVRHGLAVSYRPFGVIVR